MRISDWSAGVVSSDLFPRLVRRQQDLLLLYSLSRRGRILHAGRNREESRKKRYPGRAPAPCGNRLRSGGDLVLHRLALGTGHGEGHVGNGALIASARRCENRRAPPARRAPHPTREGIARRRGQKKPGHRSYTTILKYA